MSKPKRARRNDRIDEHIDERIDILVEEHCDEPCSETIADAVSQTSVLVGAQSAPMAMGSVYQTFAHSAGMIFENAVANQQRQSAMLMATTSHGVADLHVNRVDAPVRAEEVPAPAAIPADLDAWVALIRSLQPQP